jgi:hypothetical protein
VNIDFAQWDSVGESGNQKVGLPGLEYHQLKQLCLFYLQG